MSIECNCHVLIPGETDGASRGAADAATEASTTLGARASRAYERESDGSDASQDEIPARIA